MSFRQVQGSWIQDETKQNKAKQRKPKIFIKQIVGQGAFPNSKCQADVIDDGARPSAKGPHLFVAANPAKRT